jgi:predicted transcriptional regulator of viral defense system
MPFNVPQACREIIQRQHGVISRAQALSCGISPDAIERLVRAGRWQALRRGVYTAYAGEPSRAAALWAVVLLAGDGAALSHQTAAELFKITDEPSRLIHVTIPHRRRMSPAAGVVIHRSTRVGEAIQPVLLPPRTRVEETVLDLADHATLFDTAFGVVCAAILRKLGWSGSVRRCGHTCSVTSMIRET